MKKALTVNSPIGTLVVPSGTRVNIMNIDPVTEKMTWECYDPGIMMYIGVLALSIVSPGHRATILLRSGQIKHAFFGELSEVD